MTLHKTVQCQMSAHTILLQTSLRDNRTVTTSLIRTQQCRISPPPLRVPLSLSHLWLSVNTSLIQFGISPPLPLSPPRPAFLRPLLLLLSRQLVLLTGRAVIWLPTVRAGAVIWLLTVRAGAAGTRAGVQRGVAVRLFSRSA